MSAGIWRPECGCGRAFDRRLHRLVHVRLQHPQGFRLGRPYLPPRRSRHVREPKFAGYAYASQGDPDDGIVLQPVSFWARGERNIGGVLPLIILTNCDYVEIRMGQIVKRIEPDRKTYPHLPHPPCILDHSMVTPEEFGEWGMTWRDGELVGFINGEEVVRRHLPADPLPTTLEIAADDTELRAGEKDTVRVILRALDQGGNVLGFFDDPVEVSLQGPGRIVGPTLLSFKGRGIRCLRRPVGLRQVHAAADDRWARGYHLR
jgi:beta-galactosidase